jgi:hypothetical protein
MEALRQQIYHTLSEIQPASVRQAFYALTVRGVVPKTEAAYKHVVVRMLTRMRLSGHIPYGWITDNTRWMRKPRTYSSLPDMLERTSEFYRRALWDSSPVYVEIWLEKEALSGVLYDVTEVYDVPLMVTRGYPSLTYLYEAAEVLNALASRFTCITSATTILAARGNSKSFGKPLWPRNGIAHRGATTRS